MEEWVTVLRWAHDVIAGASRLSAIAVAAGLALMGEMMDWRHWALLRESPWGRSITVGSALGLMLILFHYVVERHLSPEVEEANPLGLVYVERRLRLIPRVGLVVLLATVGAMVYAAGGL